MGSRVDTDLVLDALLMALWRRQPKQAITVYSDQGCQFTGQEWQKALRDHNRVCSMSRRGNCNDNAGDTSPVEFKRRIPNGSRVFRNPGAIHLRFEAAQHGEARSQPRRDGKVAKPGRVLLTGLQVG